MNNNTSYTTRYVNYVIVVHGIGDQRPNESVLPVINRFSEVRQNAHEPQRREVVSLGMITSQTGKPTDKDGVVEFKECKPWSEFKNIPQDPYDKLPPFLGEPSFRGENIRFVDMYWADIMEEDFKDVGQSTGNWAKSLLGRLETKAMPFGDGKFRGNNAEAWILPILYQLEESLIFFNNLLSLRFPFIGDLIFNKFLGDVQLYGEYQQIRGRAVRRFHDLMEKIEREHILQLCPNSSDQHKYRNEEEKEDIIPQYTIISHSLGSVMAMDSLLYAHINKEIYNPDSNFSFANIPFPGYANAHELVGKEKDHDEEKDAILKGRKEFLGENWTENICNFVTLGSPIDKFLTIWWNNYLYLGSERSLLAKSNDTTDYLFRKRKHKIRHFNYCDEQDPVGDKLDKFKSRKVYGHLFESVEDIVYHRYSVPGVAHVRYWSDIELFKRIVRRAVDDEPQEELDKDFPNFNYKPGTYGSVMFYSYGLFQLIAVILMTFWGLWSWEGETWTISVLGAIGLVSSTYFLRGFIKLNVWWRQALKHKNPTYQSAKSPLRKKAQMMNIGMWLMLILVTVLPLLYIPTYMSLVTTTYQDVTRYIGVCLELTGAIAGGALIHYLFYARQRGLPTRMVLKTAEFLTILYLTILAILIAVLSYFGYKAMIYWFPYEVLYNNVVVAFMLSTTAVVVYTVLSQTLANRTVMLRTK